MGENQAIEIVDRDDTQPDFGHRYSSSRQIVSPARALQAQASALVGTRYAVEDGRDIGCVGVDFLDRHRKQ